MLKKAEIEDMLKHSLVKMVVYEVWGNTDDREDSPIKPIMLAEVDGQAGAFADVLGLELYELVEQYYQKMEKAGIIKRDSKCKDLFILAADNYQEIDYRNLVLNAYLKLGLSV